MKLMLCRHCGDVVQMRPQVRVCVCGRSRGRYLDQATVEQTEGSVSLALHNHDLRTAVEAFDENPAVWHPLMVFRAYVNPITEGDLRFAEPGPDDESTDAPAGTLETPAGDGAPEAHTPPEAPPDDTHA